MDPFESSSMVHSGATGLVDDWRTRVASPYSTTSSQSLTLNLQTPNRNASPLSPMGATSVALMSMSSPLSLSVCFDISHHLSIDPKSVFQFEEAPLLPTFTLPRIVNGSKVFPGIKDLPAHIRQNFRNEFIRFVIKQVANSQSPWVNPDVNALQAMYQLVYPVFPARLRHSDAVYHPVSGFLTVTPENSDAVGRPSRHLVFSVTTLLLPPSPLSNDTYQASSARKGFKLSIPGLNTWQSSLDQMMITQSSGGSMLKETFRTIPKSVGTKRYARFTPYITSSLNVLYRRGVAFSSQIQSWKRF